MTTPLPDWMPTEVSSPLDEKLGIEFVDFNPDRLVATMPVQGNEQPFGLLHGGATCSLVETIGSWAALLGAGPGRKAVGIELNATYMKAATAGVVTAVCTPVRRGRSLATFRIEVSDDQGSTTASARLTCRILPA
ncbi:PaaI family thioesterase [Blastococcus brunescens]|uniref:PaaI family thioesterase n=1 Tax=Blastococcus brunescens TaxID=1564165 RepID=A0ABZ1B6Z4_9ACTN|nr:PaaI family thioesterase [Blastococcus sp. BMG 8361]WRL66152.1 PaaI family thioesterase [Blastococcus sp. BMG 8361]